MVSTSTRSSNISLYLTMFQKIIFRVQLQYPHRHHPQSTYLTSFTSNEPFLFRPCRGRASPACWRISATWAFWTKFWRHAMTTTNFSSTQRGTTGMLESCLSQQTRFVNHFYFIFIHHPVTWIQRKSYRFGQGAHVDKGDFEQDPRELVSRFQSWAPYPVRCPCLKS